MCGKMFVWLLATVLLATGSPVEAQQPTRTARIGLLGGMSRSTLLGVMPDGGLGQRAGLFGGKNLASKSVGLTAS